jgi:hypothetical protein
MNLVVVPRRFKRKKWLVLIRPSLAGFDSTPDSNVTCLMFADSFREVISDDAVRAIASSFPKTLIAGQGSVRATLTVHPTDRALAASMAEVLSNPALPANARNFFQTQLGNTILGFILGSGLTFCQMHHEDVSQIQLEQFVKEELKKRCTGFALTKGARSTYAYA